MLSLSSFSWEAIFNHRWPPDAMVIQEIKAGSPPWGGDEFFPFAIRPSQVEHLPGYLLVWREMVGGNMWEHWVNERRAGVGVRVRAWKQTLTADGFWESQGCPPCPKIAHVNRWPYAASILSDGDVQPWNVICYAIYQNSHPSGAVGTYWEETRKNEWQACVTEINSKLFSNALEWFYWDSCATSEYSGAFIEMLFLSQLCGGVVLKYPYC